MIRFARQASRTTAVAGGFIAPLCHISGTLSVQHFTGFVIAHSGTFLGRVIFTDREQAKAAAIGQSQTCWDELASEGWSIIPVHAEITRIDA